LNFLFLFFGFGIKIMKFKKTNLYSNKLVFSSSSSFYSKLNNGVFGDEIKKERERVKNTCLILNCPK